MSVRISVYVTPKSGRDEIAGWRGGELSVKLTAAPEAGKANAALCKFLGKALGVPKSAVSVVRGDTARHKQVVVDGIDESRFAEVFGRPDPPLF